MAQSKRILGFLGVFLLGAVLWCFGAVAQPADNAARSGVILTLNGAVTPPAGVEHPIDPVALRSSTQGTCVAEGYAFAARSSVDSTSLGAHACAVAGPQPCETRPGAQTTSRASSARAARDILCDIATTARSRRAGRVPAANVPERLSVLNTPTRQSLGGRNF